MSGDIPKGFGLACHRCGLVPRDDIEVGDLQVHMLMEHATTDIALDLVWLGQPLPCPDRRWTQCKVDPLCYRGGANGTPHAGDCWLKGKP